LAQRNLLLSEESKDDRRTNKFPVSVNHAGFYASAEKAIKAIYEENGIYDLTGLDFNTGVTAVLRFNCIYYPDVYLTRAA